MSSTEALDQVAEDTSKLDISTENGPTNPPKQDISQESQQEIPPTVETENDGKSSQKEETRASSRKDSQKDETASRKNSETTTSRKNSETADESGAKPTVKSLPKGFRDSFRAFAKFGDTKSDGKSITLSQSDKWMKQAKVIEGKKLTTTDTGIYFKKFKSLKIGLSDYHKFIQSLVQSKGLCEDDLVQKMADCGAPGTNINTASPGQIQDTITRLTDPSKYTGSHKLRFDEAGKGKGLAGRKDVADGASAGYVHGYQNRNSYDKTH